jgi:hypothetical protein
MMNRIVDAVATTLYNARLYLATQPFELQSFRVTRAGVLVNDAIPILFEAECQVRMENSQN